jgi:D-alanine-D-alanine ligase
MRGGGAGFIPVLHAATRDRPDEIDTLVAAEAVAAALAALGYETEIIGLGLDLTVIEALRSRRPLLVFNLVDAVRGDGRLAPMVPALLEGFGLRFTGASTSAWLETLSKIATKERLRSRGLPTPDWSEDGQGLASGTNVIVKPVWEHGSLGIDASSVVRGADAARLIAERTFRYHTAHFAEGFIEGREFNLALIGSDSGVDVLPIAEIVFEGLDEPQIVGYDAKWTPESQAYIGTPRRFGVEREDKPLAAELSKLALACWTLFGLSGYARVDFRVDAQGSAFILEVNLNPCLSPDAGFAAAAAEAGLSYPNLIGRIVAVSLGGLKATA